LFWSVEKFEKQKITRKNGKKKEQIFIQGKIQFMISCFSGQEGKVRLVLFWEILFLKLD